MKLIDIIKISLQNLFRQKIRTLLTIFSIVIGATLISLVYAVIPGFENFFDLQFNAFSPPTLIEVSPSSTRPGHDIFGGLGKAPSEYTEGDTSNSFDFDMGSFKDEDIENMRSIDGVKEVYESIFPSVDYVRLEDDTKKFKAGFVIYSPSFILKNMDLVAGTYFEEDDRGKVIISNQFLESFEIEDPNELIGKKINLHVTQIKPIQLNDKSMMLDDSTEDIMEDSKDFEFEIVGITEKTIISSAIYISFEDGVEMNRFLTASDDVMTDNDDNRQFISVELTDAALANSVKEKIEELGFSARTFDDSKSILNDMFDIITVIFSSFGVLAMSVSSLGILNTLIMAVMERTREIGVMKAIGATRGNIAVLFTLEAAFIGLLGGLIGLGVGLGLSEILNIISHRTFLESFETLDLSNITPLILLGPIISTVVATIAGIYPAVRAAKLDPVKALRYE